MRFRAHFCSVTLEIKFSITDLRYRDTSAALKRSALMTGSWRKASLMKHFITSAYSPLDKDELNFPSAVQQSKRSLIHNVHFKTHLQRENFATDGKLLESGRSAG